MIGKIVYNLVLGFSVIRTLVDEFGSLAKVVGRSMQPTFNPHEGQDDFIVINRWKRYDVSKGEIVVLISPREPNCSIVKRVVGIEGDKIVPHKCTCSVLETVHAVKGDKQVTSKCNCAVEIPKGYMWVEGDNVHESHDSNYFGPVPTGLISGKAICIIWPPKRIKLLSKTSCE